MTGPPYLSSPLPSDPTSKIWDSLTPFGKWWRTWRGILWMGFLGATSAPKRRRYKLTKAIYVHALLQGFATALTSFTATITAMSLATQSAPHAGLAMVAAFTGSLAAGIMSGLNYLNTSAGKAAAAQDAANTPTTPVVYMTSGSPTVTVPPVVVAPAEPVPAVTPAPTPQAQGVNV